MILRSLLLAGRIWLFALAVALTGMAARGEAILRGVVYLNETSGRTLPGVRVTSAGSNGDVTDSDGRFRLVFPDRKPGQHIRLVITLEGHELVNDLQADVVTLPAQADEASSERVFLLCRAGERDRWACRYFRLRLEEDVERAFAEGERRLKQEGEDRARELARLRTERVQALAMSRSPAEQSGAGALPAGSAMLRDAQRAFLDGRVDEALRILDEVKIREDLARVEKVRRDAVDALLLKARLQISRLDFAAADRLFTEALGADPGHLPTVFAVGMFRFEQKRYREARPLLDQAVHLARVRNDRIEISMTLNSLGSLLYAQQELPGSRNAYEEALAIRRELMVLHNGLFRPDLAMTLNNLAEVLRVQGEVARAREFFEEALSAYRKLAAANPTEFRPHVGTTLNNLGNLLSDQQDFLGSRVAYEEALTIYRELSAFNPKAFRPDVAMLLNNLGTLSSMRRDWSAARTAYEEAVAIYRDLATADPGAFRPSLAKTLNNLGILFAAQRDLDRARKAYNEALAIYRDLATANPEAFRKEVAMVLNNLGRLLVDKRDLDEASMAFKEALAICRELATANPQAFQQYVAKTLYNLGELFRIDQDLDEARTAYNDALKIYRDLAAANPDAFRPYVSMTLCRLGEIMSANRDSLRARKAYEEALAILRDLVASNPEMLTLPLCETLLSLAKLEGGLGLGTQSIARLHLGEAERLLEGVPPSLPRDRLASLAKQLRDELEKSNP